MLETILTTNAVNSQSYFMQAYHNLKRMVLKENKILSPFIRTCISYIYLSPQPKNK